METLQQRLMRKVPGLRAPQPVGGIRMPASGFTAPSVPAPQVPQVRPDIPGVGSTKTVLNAPKKGNLLTDMLKPANLLREAAISGGLYGAGKLAESAGTPGQARMSGLGLMGPAPVYQTPLNNVTVEQVAADKAMREGQTALEKVIGRPPAKEEQLPSTYNVMGVDYDSATGQAINPNTKKISSGGYAIVPGSNKRIDYKKGEDRLNSLGTDTSSGDRETPGSDPRNANYIQQRGALTADSTAAERSSVQDAGMAAWAKANPELAKRMVATQDRRLETNPGFKQSGYEAVRNELYPERAVLAAEGNQGGFSVRDAVGGGMSPEEAGAIASGGFVETVFDKGVQGESKITNNSAEKATDLLSSYKKGLIGKAAGESEASEVQNPIVAGGDGTPDGAISELQKATTPLKDRFTLTPDEVGAAIKAGGLDSLVAQQNQLGRKF